MLPKNKPGKPGIIMNNHGSISIPTIILLISFTLVGFTVASVINEESDVATEDQIDEILDDVLNEVTTYIQIKDKIGKYYKIDNQQKIQRIAILIKPLISTNIDVSELTIKLSNSNDVKILRYSEKASFIESQLLFEHPIWNEINEDNFGFLIINDNDRSLIDYNVINNDMAYIIIKLSDGYSMVKGETILLTMFPSSGITKTTLLKAPMPMKSVISFD